MAKDTFTTYEISQICRVFMTTVANWIDEGKLPAYRTPGGHRRVLRRDLAVFLEKYGMPLPDAMKDEEGKRILVVDDNPSTVSVIVDALLRRDPGYVVRTASNGFEAGRQVASFRPHVLVLDVVLPGLDGLQVCQALRKDPATIDTCVIVITGHDEKSTRREFEALDVHAYMEKPLDLDVLLDHVEAGLDRPEKGTKVSSRKDKA